MQDSFDAKIEWSKSIHERSVISSWLARNGMHDDTDLSPYEQDRPWIAHAASRVYADADIVSCLRVAAEGHVRAEKAAKESQTQDAPVAKGSKKDKKGKGGSATSSAPPSASYFFEPISPTSSRIVEVILNTLAEAEEDVLIEACMSFLRCLTTLSGGSRALLTKGGELCIPDHFTIVEKAKDGALIFAPEDYGYHSSLFALQDAFADRCSSDAGQLHADAVAQLEESWVGRFSFYAYS